MIQYVYPVAIIIVVYFIGQLLKKKLGKFRWLIAFICLSLLYLDYFLFTKQSNIYCLLLLTVFMSCIFVYQKLHKHLYTDKKTKQRQTNK
jgi:chromate transport protein ChrA